jgi:hypothetical protein
VFRSSQPNCSRGASPHAARESAALEQLNDLN